MATFSLCAHVASPPRVQGGREGKGGGKGGKDSEHICVGKLSGVSSYKDTNPIGSETHLMTYLALIPLLEASSPKQSQ